MQRTSRCPLSANSGHSAKLLDYVVGAGKHCDKVRPPNAMARRRSAELDRMARYDGERVQPFYRCIFLFSAREKSRLLPKAAYTDRSCPELSAYVDGALLSRCLGSGRGLRRQLKYCSHLTLT